MSRRRWWIAFVVSPAIMAGSGLLMLWLWDGFVPPPQLHERLLGLLSCLGLLAGLGGWIWGIAAPSKLP